MNIDGLLRRLVFTKKDPPHSGSDIKPVLSYVELFSTTFLNILVGLENKTIIH